MGLIPAGMKNIGNIQNTLKEAADKQGEAARILVDQNEAILDTLNEHTKALVSVYKAVEKLAKKLEVKLPEPLTDMTVDEAKQ